MSFILITRFNYIRLNALKPFISSLDNALQRISMVPSHVGNTSKVKQHRWLFYGHIGAIIGNASKAFPIKPRKIQHKLHFRKQGK